MLIRRVGPRIRSRTPRRDRRLTHGGPGKPADAFDAALITGGLPLIRAEWPHGGGMWDFLRTALEDPVSALLVSAERSPAAEFPQQAQARTVLSAIGSGERTLSNVARAADGIGGTPLQRALGLLTEKRVIAAELPLSTRPSKDRRHRVADPYLRFCRRSAAIRRPRRPESGA